MPTPLEELVELLKFFSADEKAAYLLELAQELQEVPASIAMRPFPKQHQVPYCESEAYVWAVEREDKLLDFYFAVENPQGVSAKAVAAALGESLSGRPLEEVAGVDSSIVDSMFGRTLSMGKGAGLRAMVDMVMTSARKKLSEQR